MSIRWGRIAVITVAGIVAGVFELAKIALEVSHGSMPTSWVDFLLSGLTVLALVSIVGELRHRLRVLRRPRIIRKLAGYAFAATAICTAGICLYGLWRQEFLWVGLTYAMCIPLALFGALSGDPDDTAEPTLFDWRRRKDAELEHERQMQENQRRRLEHEQFLKENPDLAALEKLPMRAKIRIGL